MRPLYLVCFLMLPFCACSSRISDEGSKKLNVLETIYSIADSLDMKVMCDMNVIGGALYDPDADNERVLDSLVKSSDEYICSYYKEFGSHDSFWGWYLNNEINPVDSLDFEQTQFWRKLFSSISDKCHSVAPGTKVTISPFYLLDVDGYRGFRCQSPEEYEKWWYGTMAETGIDILMLQDSGEHLSFFTLEDREPFLAAAANACLRAGKEFWVNVEAGQVKAKDWQEAVDMEWNKSKKWEFTPMDWLEQKLRLASKYATGIVNWGYYPFMNPVEADEPVVDGQMVDPKDRAANYNAYRKYVESLPEAVPEGLLVQPKIQGTLWFLNEGMEKENPDELRNYLREEIVNQKNLGFSILWICKTAYYFSIVE